MAARIEGRRNAEQARSTAARSAPEAPPPDPPALERLVEDLRVLLPLRSRTSIRDRPFPAIHGLLSSAGNDREQRYAALVGAIDEAAAAIPDPAARRAATALFAFEGSRWRPLTQRGPEAAAVYGCGWDAFRRRRQGPGASLLDETVEALARSLVRVAGRAVDVGAGRADRAGSARFPEDRHDGGTGTEIPDQAPAPGPDDPLRSGRGARPPRRRRLVLAVAAAVALGTVAASVLVARRADDPVDCGLLVHDVGDVAPDAGADITQRAEMFRSAAATAGPRARCAGLIEFRNGRIVQQISAGSGSGDGALVVGVDDVSVVTLTPSEVLQLAFLDAREPERPGRLGRPVRRADRPDGTLMVDFENGAIVRDRFESPAWIVVGPQWQEWERLGGIDGALGRPLSNNHGDPDEGALVQEFQRGRLVTTYDGELLPWQPVDHPERDLPADPEGTVLRSSDGTTYWFVDLEGRRRWLPSYSDVSCMVTSQRATETIKVPAAAIATLPGAEAYRCR